MLMLVKPLGKTFGVLICEGNKLYMMTVKENKFMNEMIIKLNVLGMIMKNWVGSSVGSDKFITVGVKTQFSIHMSLSLSLSLKPNNLLFIFCSFP